MDARQTPEAQGARVELTLAAFAADDAGDEDAATLALLLAGTPPESDPDSDD